jgi:UDP-N-acetylglucosamine 2-epimerase (non-hydrolysing)
MTADSICLVAGARPNFMKLAPVYRALVRRGAFKLTFVHTGQHYDAALSEVFLRDLGLPAPDVTLEAGSGRQGAQTARILERFEQALMDREPDLVVVFGDVNSTVACVLAAAKMVYPSGRRPRTAHVEAGLRSFDRSMPEEVNRIVTDAVSDLLFTSEPSASENLRREGVPSGRIFFVGNVMIDTLHSQLAQAGRRRAWADLGLPEGGYGVVTLHRPSNVDDPRVFRELLGALAQGGRRVPLVFPAHPRTVARLRESADGLEDSGSGVLRVLPPLGYLDFLSLMMGARMVLTDSGGIQEETTALGIPCLTLRHTTERPVTVAEGTNRLVGTDRHAIGAAVDRLLRGEHQRGRTPDLWDGRAAERIADVIAAAR